MRKKLDKIGVCVLAGLLIIVSYALATTPAEAGVLIEPGHLDFGWREVAYAAVTFGMYMIDRRHRAMDKKICKLFKWMEDLQKEFSELKGAHNANHGASPKT